MISRKRKSNGCSSSSFFTSILAMYSRKQSLPSGVGDTGWWRLCNAGVNTPRDPLFSAKFPCTTAVTSVVAHVKALPHDIIGLGADDDDFIVYTKQPGEAFEAPVNKFG